MAHFDVFNGDADGICALHQLRLAHPIDSTLVTGVKRDIALLERVHAHPGDSVTVLDISSDVNRTTLLALLERGVSVQYFDHHGSGEVPAHPRLDAHIDTAANTCTGIIVDRWLDGRYRVWAAVAAFGDNFPDEARKLTQELALSNAQIDALQELGECINYNAYGDSEDDLVMRPAELYRVVHHHSDPFSFIASEPVFRLMRDARRLDMEMAARVSPHASVAGGQVTVLPDEPWSRRVRGTLANRFAIDNPEQAFAAVTPNVHGGYTISVRAPLVRRSGADTLCKMFPTGGGRPAAAGVTHLPRERLEEFVRAFERMFGGNAHHARD